MYFNVSVDYSISENRADTAIRLDTSEPPRASKLPSGLFTTANLRMNFYNEIPGIGCEKITKANNAMTFDQLRHKTRNAPYGA
jgi:hypothetical protein